MKKVLAIILTMALCFSMSSAFAFAASANMSGGTCKVGETVSVTLKYSGEKFGSAMPVFSYDTSILKYESYSGGSGTTVTPSGNGKKFFLDAGGSSSLSVTLKFKAIKSGTTTVSVASAEGANWDGDDITLSGAKCTVTVNKVNKVVPQEKNASGEKVYETNKKTKESTMGANSDKEEVDPSIKPDIIPVVIGDKTYGIVEDLKGIEIPEGFKTIDLEYGKYKWKIRAIEEIAYSESDLDLKDKEAITMVLIKDPEGKDVWAFYNKEKGKVSLKTSIDNSEYLYLHEESVAVTNSDSIIPMLIAASFALMSLLLAIYILVTNKKHKKKK